MKLKMLIVLAFFVGYFVNDLVEFSQFSRNANAAVAGMSARDLRADLDFRRAVMSVAEEECKTDIDPRTFNTWFYCGGSSSRFAPR